VTDERLTLRQASARLGVSESAVRKRVERGTLRSDKGPDGRRYVYLDTGADTMADKGADASDTSERDALISERVEELRDEVHYLRGQLQQELDRRSAEAERYQQIVAALTTANASLSERLRALEPPSQPRESPETVEEAPDRTDPQSATGKAQEGTERPQQRSGWHAPVDKLPWWHYVLGLVLVSLASYFSSTLASNFLPASVFGLWVGFRRRHPRFRSQIIPFGILVGLAIALGDTATSPLREWVSAYERFSVADFAAYLAGYITSTILAGWLFYVSGALIGSAWQRRRTERLSGTAPAVPMPSANLASPGSRTAWTPRQQAILGFVGTIIAALISLLD
jgi:hypothetical protein